MRDPTSEAANRLETSRAAESFLRRGPRIHLSEDEKENCAERHGEQHADADGDGAVSAPFPEQVVLAQRYGDNEIAFGQRAKRCSKNWTAWLGASAEDAISADVHCRFEQRLRRCDLSD